MPWIVWDRLQTADGHRLGISRVILIVSFAHRTGHACRRAPRHGIAAPCAGCSSGSGRHSSLLWRSRPATGGRLDDAAPSLPLRMRARRSRRTAEGGTARPLEPPDGSACPRWAAPRAAQQGLRKTPLQGQHRLFVSVPLAATRQPTPATKFGNYVLDSIQRMRSAPKPVDPLRARTLCRRIPTSRLSFTGPQPGSSPRIPRSAASTWGNHATRAAAPPPEAPRRRRARRDRRSRLPRRPVLVAHGRRERPDHGTAARRTPASEWRGGWRPTAAPSQPAGRDRPLWSDGASGGWRMTAAARGPSASGGPDLGAHRGEVGVKRVDVGRQQRVGRSRRGGPIGIVPRTTGRARRAGSARPRADRGHAIRPAWRAPTATELRVAGVRRPEPLRGGGLRTAPTIVRWKPFSRRISARAARRPVDDPQVAADRAPGASTGRSEVAVLVHALRDQRMRELEEQCPGAGTEQQHRLAVDAPRLVLGPYSPAPGVGRDAGRRGVAFARPAPDHPPRRTGTRAGPPAA